MGMRALSSNVRQRVVSGMRPTARLHLGSLEGALRLWTELQRDSDCYFLVADLHALTTSQGDTTRLSGLIRDMVLDWLAAGLDPQHAVIFVQSQVPAHAELALLLGTITPVPWLERCVTYKEWMATPEVARTAGLGLLAYPVLQAADTLLYQATTVPAGRDQVQHIELTRDIVGRFNSLFGTAFPLPVVLHSDAPALPGTDGRKMSSAYGNAIYLEDSCHTVDRKVMSMFTDPSKVFRGDVGHPQRCPVFTLHRCYSLHTVGEIDEGCSRGRLDCVECKGLLAQHINSALEPLREQRRVLESDPELLHDVLREGARRARSASEETVTRVREAMGLGSAGM